MLTSSLGSSFELVLDISTVFGNIYYVKGWLRRLDTKTGPETASQQHGGGPKERAKRLYSRWIKHWQRAKAINIADARLITPNEPTADDAHRLSNKRRAIRPLTLTTSPHHSIADAEEFTAYFLHPARDVEILGCQLSLKVGNTGWAPEKVTAGIADLNNDRFTTYSLMGWIGRFKDYAITSCMERNASEDAPATTNRTSLLDIGGRARSGALHSEGILSDFDVTVADIVNDAGVDIVADAHELSRHFRPDSFDCFFSSCVFEHLHSPWQCILEINKVLKRGGIGLVITHQTLGIHDAPCDYLRFSADSWPAFFNETTGFEVIEAGQDVPSFIVPFIMRADKINLMAAAGFEYSWVIVRKTSQTDQRWEIAASLSTRNYPAETTDAPAHAHFQYWD
jgi:SAM-dependent methyltransferase